MQLVDAFQLWSVSFWVMLKQPVLHLRLHTTLNQRLDMHLLFVHAQLKVYICFPDCVSYTDNILKTFGVMNRNQWMNLSGKVLRRFSSN